MGGNVEIITQPTEIDRALIDSRYRFAIAVAMRAKQLIEGAVPTKKSRVKKQTTLALEEVSSGTVRVLSGETAARAREEAEKTSFEKLIDEAGKKKTHVEDLSGLEKNVMRYLTEKREDGEEFFPWEIS
jgi:DNA-directed RNA polymerase subunit K/omega